MRQLAKLLLGAGILTALLATAVPSAVQARENAQEDLNQLVQEGILSPQQASALGSRWGNRGSWGNWVNFNADFGFIPGSPVHYDSNLINKAASQVRHLQGDGLISPSEKFLLDRQLEARVHLVNEHPGITQSAYNYGSPGGSAYQNGMTGYYPGSNPFHPGMNPFHPGMNPFHQGMNPLHAGMYGFHPQATGYPMALPLNRYANAY